MGIISDILTRSYRTSPKNLPPGGQAAVVMQDKGRATKSSVGRCSWTSVV